MLDALGYADDFEFMEGQSFHDPNCANYFINSGGSKISFYMNSLARCVNCKHGYALDTVQIMDFGGYGRMLTKR
jgi:hypothetical protein